MRRKRRFVLILLLLAVALMVGTPFWILDRQARQEALNEDLITSARIGNVAEVKSLLDQGADPNARDSPPPEPRGLLAWLGDLLTGRKQNLENRGRTALRSATDSRHPYLVVKLLLERGADIKADNASEEPALSWAARGGDVETVKLLLDHGADVNAKDIVGFTALMGAVLSGNARLVKLLLDRGAEVHANSALGTPLGMASSPEIVALLKNATKQKPGR